MKRTPSIKRNEKIEGLIDAALERYSHEELFAAFLETALSVSDRAAIAELIQKDELLMDAVLAATEFEKIPSDQLEQMKSILEINGFEVFKCESLVEQMRFEQFLSELKSNPYELELKVNR